MDAAEADSDVKLYKASGELLLELQAKVPRLVRYSKQGQHQFRKWVIGEKVYEVTHLLDSFQEWPQLLDPYLASLLQVLVDAYLWYCVTCPQEYVRRHDVDVPIYPLPRAIAAVLYAFCKVRGRKVIVRLLNNEPKYIEPLLSSFHLWTAGSDNIARSDTSQMTWEERYIHLLWLSHLMLAPFELSTISGLSVDQNKDQGLPELHANLPDVAANLAMVGLKHLHESSKAREAASTLLVRLSLRSDMQKLGLAERLVDWAISELQMARDKSEISDYRYIGLLELLFGITNSASDSEASPFINNVFRLAYRGATSSEKQFEMIRNSAPARKLLIKLIRTATVHGVAVSETNGLSGTDLDVNEMLDECIQTLLEFLPDKDTPVRQAASKALSQVCLKLVSDMAAEVVEAVVDSLNENMLLESIVDGSLFPATNIVKSESANYKKNINAVDPLKWHGCMLTLGHLLFRRSLPPNQLPEVIEVLLMGLDFEQRSNVGTSVGVSVRDAACFGVWSLARKYSTSELNQATISRNLLPYPVSFSGVASSSTLQTIATHLAMSACLDPSGNLRRGSSAALQELIGRHPDAISEGIPVVQTIDYHAVARRARAVTEIAVDASNLSEYYHGALLYSLLGWRGARATDADSRRHAAHAVGRLVKMCSKNDVFDFIEELTAQIKQLKMSNSGSNAGARHGLMCILATVVESFVHQENIDHENKALAMIRLISRDIETLTGTVAGRVTVDIENVLEGVSKFIEAAAHFIAKLVSHSNDSDISAFPQEWRSQVLPILKRCTLSCDREIAANAAAQANGAILNLLDKHVQASLVSSWIDTNHLTQPEFRCKGRIATLGKAFSVLHSAGSSEQLARQILLHLVDTIRSYQHVETRVHAMQSISAIVSSDSNLEDEDLEALTEAIHVGLNDYTMDQRGDIGSLVRLESIDAAERFAGRGLSMGHREQILPSIARLAAEKLVKVRFQAWRCLEVYLRNNATPLRVFNHQADVSSVEYFSSILQLLRQPQVREHLLVGLIGSLSGGTEEVSRASSKALIAYVQNLDETTKTDVVNWMIQIASRHMTSMIKADDRDALPAIGFFTFIVEHLFAVQPSLTLMLQEDNIWEPWQSMQTASASLLRYDAIVKMYSALTLLKRYRIRALDKLTRLLLHRWPKIRAAAADAIFLCTSSQSIVLCDWNASVTENKAAVLALRKHLNVTGSIAVKPAPKHVTVV